MDFVLKIFFSGLIAFLPNADGTEMTVLLVNTPHQYALADGSPLAHHTPMLLARAAVCEGDVCRNDDRAALAPLLFSNKTQQEALASLNGALGGGGAFVLSGSDLSIAGPREPLNIVTNARGRTESGAPKAVPTTPEEREDVTWLASLREIAPGSGGFKTALTAGDEPPPGCLIAARLKLRSGRFFTYSVSRIDGKARPVHFRRPAGEGADAPYAQALATWMAAEIHVPGDAVEIVDQSFSDPARRRSIKLHPLQGVVELALLNLPPHETPADPSAKRVPQPGQHFQIYYDLVKTPPARAARLVPQQAVTPSPAEPQVEWSALHPMRAERWSELLERLGLNPRGKGPYEVAFCPMVRE